MGMSFDAPDDVQGDGGNYLSEPGTYHMVITNVREGEGKKGTPVDGLTIECDVLGGTVDGCAGKTHSETLFAPNLNQSDESQLAAQRRLAAFFIATGVMTPDQLGKSLELDVAKANEKQIVIKLVRQMEKNDQTGKYDIPTKYLQVDYASIYHVDDPEVKDVPKSEDALQMIDASDRHDESWFEFKAKRGKQPQQAQPAGATSGVVDDVDDLI